MGAVRRTPPVAFCHQDACGVGDSCTVSFSVEPASRSGNRVYPDHLYSPEWWIPFPDVEDYHILKSWVLGMGIGVIWWPVRIVGPLQAFKMVVRVELRDPKVAGLLHTAKKERKSLFISNRIGKE